MQDSWIKLYVTFWRNRAIIKFQTILLDTIVDHIKTIGKSKNFPIKTTRNTKDKPFKILLNSQAKEISENQIGGKNVLQRWICIDRATVRANL